MSALVPGGSRARIQALFGHARPTVCVAPEVRAAHDECGAHGRDHDAGAPTPARTLRTDTCRDRVKSVLPLVLRRRIGRGRKHSLEQIAAAAGVAPRALRGYLAGESMAPADALIAILGVLGPAVADELLAPAGIGGSRWLGRQGEGAQAIVTGLARAAAELSKALEDGRLDHLEKFWVAKHLREINCRIAEFATALDE